jgi:pyruvate formate lyase activating enzyme
MNRLSLVDFPGKLCMNLIVPGCNYRCAFCPNEQLIHHHIPMPKIGMVEIVKILRPRMGFLDGVSLSGGEPFLHRGLGSFLSEMRFQNIKVRIKTNASRPGAIQWVLDEGLIDFLSVFIPAPLSKYADVVNYRIDPKDVRRSIQIVRKSNVPYEFRVKPVPGLVEKEDILEIANTLSGSRRLVIERFDPIHTLDPNVCGSKVFSQSELEDIRDSASPYFGEVILSN